MIRKKLREAQFFLAQMRDWEGRAFGDKEPFDFNLSAFLNAGRVVDYRLRREHPSDYPAWRKAWNANLSPADDSLIKFMVDDRDREVHESGSSRSVGTQSIPVGNMGYSDKSGTLYVYGPPGTPPAAIDKSTYAFTIEGTERKATEACAEYLALLNQMVAKFTAEVSSRKAPSE